MAYAILKSVSEAGNTRYGIGILFLLTGGIFLYVATMHVLPEVLGPPHQHAHEMTDENDHNQNQNQNQNEACKSDSKLPDGNIRSSLKIGLIMVGLAIPLLLTLAIPHKH